MSLTLFNINLLTDKENQETLLMECNIHFGQQCIVNEPGITDFFNVFWITGGKAKIKIDFTEFETRQDTLFFLLPGQVFTVLEANHITGYRLAFTRDFYFISTQHPEIGCSGILFNTFKFGPVIRMEKNEVAELKKLIGPLEDAINSGAVANTEMVQSYLKIFLIQCANAKRRQLNQLTKNEFSSLSELNEFNTIIEKHFKKWHRVKEYADLLHITPKTLTKKLSRYGKSPSNLIYDRLILEAKRLMYYSHKSIKEIASELGFNDPYHFSRFFKTHTGTSPREFMNSGLVYQHSN